MVLLELIFEVPGRLDLKQKMALVEEDIFAVLGGERGHRQLTCFSFGLLEISVLLSSEQ